MAVWALERIEGHEKRLAIGLPGSRVAVRRPSNRKITTGGMADNGQFALQQFRAAYDSNGSKTGPSRHGAFPIADIIALIGSAAKADIA
jgi:hypothetical protein